jgi:hypothetical protein
MFQFLLNPSMLLGLAGISLPVIAHLLSRRRFDVVEWGAMQFLNPSRKTRRRLKLEELLLLLLRIGLIILIVLAVTRPIIPSGWFSGYHSAGARTVVIVIDGSNSMSRTDGVNSVHQHAMRRAAEFLQSLGPDDNVALIDARDQPRSVIESPLRDIHAVTEQIKKLPPPGGACDTLAAIEKAIGILGRSSSSAREIVVFSDRQAQGWRSSNDAEWARIDEMLKFPAVRPQVWVVDVTSHLSPVDRNISVGRIELSREMSVPDFPVRLRVAIRNDSSQEIQVPVRLLLNNQALAGKIQNPLIPPQSETMLEFDYAIRPEGTHVLSVEAEATDDAIPLDNVSHAAVHVTSSLSVLLINGTASAIPSDRDTFFLELAFAPPEGRTPWVSARAVESSDLKAVDFHATAVAVCCNVNTMSAKAASALAAFVSEGNGAIIACGPDMTPESFQQCFGDSGLLQQLQLVRTREAPPQSEEQIRVAPLSIQPGWLDRFRSDPARSFLKSTFSAWSLTKPASKEPHKTAPAENTQRPIAAKADATRNLLVSTASAPIMLAQLSTGDPLILEARHGNGVVLLMTSTLDRTWNDLPTRSDFVPFLYEAVFHVASARSHRNVLFAEPLLVRLPTDSQPPNSQPTDRPSDRAPAKTPDAAAKAEAVRRPTVSFTSPDNTVTPASITEDSSAFAVFADTFAPGVYRVSATDPNRRPTEDAFVVNYDHSEDQLAPLTPDDKARLATKDRVRFSSSLEELKKRMYGDESITELWAILMIVFLLFLIAELLLTRRTIRKGYGGESLAAT